MESRNNCGGFVVVGSWKEPISKSSSSKEDVGPARALSEGGVGCESLNNRAPNKSSVSWTSALLRLPKLSGITKPFCGEGS